MSDLAFPVLKSSNWKLSRTPQWKTQVATSSSGVRTRNLLQTSPVWKWTLKNGILQAADTVGDLQAIQDLFIQMYGRWDFFLWTDPEGASLVDPTIALGSNPTFPVCFTHDTVDFDRFAYQLWECGELEFEQVGVPTTSGGGSTPPPVTSTSKLYIVSAHQYTLGSGLSNPGIYQRAIGNGSDGLQLAFNGWGAGGQQWDTKTDSMNVGSGSYSITFGFDTVSPLVTNAINQLLIYEVYIQQTDASGNVISTLRPSSATIVGGTNTTFNYVQNPGNAVDGNTGTYALIYSDTTHELGSPPSLQITF